MQELVRYIHLNPIRARVVSDILVLNRYKYSGHSVLMEKQNCSWQDTKYVLSHFGRRTAESVRNYYAYVKSGIDQGRRPELVGGGLIRSLGGWSEVKKDQLIGHKRLKGDERILGSSDFVMMILSEANEKYNRLYELKSKGYDLEKLEKRVTEIYQMDKDELYSRGRQKIRAEARSLFCYWAVRELGITGTSLAKRLGMSQSGVVYAVNKGEKTAKEKRYQLID